MPIRQGIVNVRPLPASSHQAGVPENPQSLRDRRELLAGCLDHLGHTGFAGGEKLEQSQPWTVAQRLEQSSGAFHGFLGSPKRLPRAPAVTTILGLAVRLR